MGKLYVTFIVKTFFEFVVFSLLRDPCHRRCSNKSAISSYNSFVSQAKLYDGPLFIQSDVHIMKQASVDNLVGL